MFHFLAFLEIIQKYAPKMPTDTQGHVITHQALETEIGGCAEGTLKRLVFTSLRFTNLDYSNIKLDRYIEHCHEFVAWMKKRCHNLHYFLPPGPILRRNVVLDNT